MTGANPHICQWTLKKTTDRFEWWLSLVNKNIFNETINKIKLDVYKIIYIIKLSVKNCKKSLTEKIKINW